MYMYESEMVWKRIELTITSWVTQSGGDLFQYKSNEYNSRQQFRTMQFFLPLPKKQIYYFFHLIKKKVKEQRYQFHLQRRNQPYSSLDQRSEGIMSYKLMGGVRLSRQTTQDRKEMVYMQPISATDIYTKTIYGKYEQMEMTHPYAVVRSFKKGYPIRPGTLLRFGKVEFSVLQVNTELVREVDYGTDDQHVLNLDNKQSIIQSTQRSTEGGESPSQWGGESPSQWGGGSPSQCGRQCKVCLMSEQQAQNMLIAPCSCSGTGRHVHLQCLREWIQQKLKKMRNSEGAFYQTNLLFCEICHQNFPRAVTKNGKTYGLLKFLQESAPYISLVPKQQSQLQNMFYISFERTQEVKVGRLAQNGVVLEQNSVSRKHAAIRYEGGRMIVIDQQSKYGTLVHQEKMKIRLGGRLKAFQISNIAFGFKIVQERNY